MKLPVICSGGHHMYYVLLVKRVLEVFILNRLCGDLMQKAGARMGQGH